MADYWLSLEDRLRILNDYKRIAMVGLSANQYRPSHFAAIYMQAQGYTIYPVNPQNAGQKILGRTVYASITEIPDPVEIVDIFRKPEDVPPIVDEAIAIGAKVIWMQLGVIHHEAAEKARQAGLEVVMDRCVKIEHGRFFGGLGTVGINSRVLSSRLRETKY
ncbi:MAG TPA: CoA-binding protein [Dehalococcoidia bacterium]|nr:CoA-binding protein [Dehalococcoidia bacterium]